MKLSLFPLLDKGDVTRLLRGGLRIEPYEADLFHAASRLAQLGILILTEVQTIRCANPNDDDFPEDVVDESCEGVIRLAAGESIGLAAEQCPLCGRFVEYPGPTKQIFVLWETALLPAGLRTYMKAANHALAKGDSPSRAKLYLTFTAKELLTENRARLRQRASRLVSLGGARHRPPIERPGYHLQSVHESLLKAFPSKESLAQMLKYELDINLNEIAANGNLNEIVHDLILYAESQERIPALVDAAQRANSGNELLAQLEY